MTDTEAQWNAFLARLSTRAMTCARVLAEHDGIDTLEKLQRATVGELMRTPNLGRVTLEEMADAAAAIGHPMPWSPRERRNVSRRNAAKVALAKVVERHGIGVVRAALDDLESEIGQ